MDINKVDVSVYLDNGSIINVERWTLSPNIKVGDIVNIHNVGLKDEKIIGFL